MPKDTTFTNIILVVLISCGLAFIIYKHLHIIKEGFESIKNESEHVEPLVDAIIYINLDDRKDRNDEILEEIKKVGLPDSKVHRLSAVKRKWGALGCSLSHIACLQFIIKNGWSRTLILEDDAGFEKSRWSAGITDVNKMILSSGKTNTDSKWDVIFLGGFVRDPNGPTKTEYENLWKTKNTSCTHAYIIRGDYAPKLLDYTETAIQMMMKYPSNQKQYNLDNAWSQLMAEDKWYITLPTLAYQRESYSDIEGKDANSEQPLRGNVVRAWAKGSLLSQ
jgi:GR25 family glycosyltransferase involved in LPS biosynthesis